VTVHATEITLTRSIEAAELNAAQQESPLLMAAAVDRKRLVVLVSAKNEHRAMRKIWKRLEDALPIDVLCSLFPGPDGKYLMSIPMSEEVHERIQRLAAAERKTPEEYVQQAIAQALARDARPGPGRTAGHTARSRLLSVRALYSRCSTTFRAPVSMPWEKTS